MLLRLEARTVRGEKARGPQGVVILQRSPCVVRALEQGYAFVLDAIQAS